MTVGTHTLKYDVSDAAGNAAEECEPNGGGAEDERDADSEPDRGMEPDMFYVEADDMRPATVLAPIKGNLVADQGFEELL